MRDSLMMKTLNIYLCIRLHHPLLLASSLVCFEVIIILKLLQICPKVSLSWSISLKSSLTFVAIYFSTVVDKNMTVGKHTREALGVHRFGM